MDESNVLGIDMVLTGQRLFDLPVAIQVVYRRDDTKLASYFTFEKPNGELYKSGLFGIDDTQRMRELARELVERKYGITHSQVDSVKEISSSHPKIAIQV